MKLFCCLFAVLCIIHGCATNVSGVVVDATGKTLAVSNGKVNIILLTSTEKRVNLIVDIDKNGYFVTKTNLQKGQYLLEPLIPGYKSESIKINIDKTVEVELTATKMTTGKKSVIGVNNDLDPGRGGGSATLTPMKL